MTPEQTLSLTLGIAAAVIGLVIAAVFLEFRRPHRLTPEEVAESICAILNEHQCNIECDPRGGIVVFPAAQNWDADNVAVGNRIIPTARRK